MGPVFPPAVTAAPEFNDNLFKQLQSLSGGLQQQNQLRTMDNTSRDPRLGGAQAMLLRQGQRSAADKLQGAKTGLQQQGLQAGLEDQNTQDEYGFQSGEADADRRQAGQLQAQTLQSQQNMAELQRRMKQMMAGLDIGGDAAGLGLSYAATPSLPPGY